MSITPENIQVAAIRVDCQTSLAEPTEQSHNMLMVMTFAGVDKYIIVIHCVGRTGDVAEVVDLVFNVVGCFGRVSDSCEMVSNEDRDSHVPIVG